MTTASRERVKAKKQHVATAERREVGRERETCVRSRATREGTPTRDGCCQQLRKRLRPGRARKLETKMVGSRYRILRSIYLYHTPWPTF